MLPVHFTIHDHEREIDRLSGYTFLDGHVFTPNTRYSPQRDPTAHLIPKHGSRSSTVAQASRRLNQITIPLLWNDIELHEEGYHESSHELKVPPPGRDPARRPYHSKQKWGNGQGARMKAAQFFERL
ncbi:hypothetical protein FGADI_4102 [Fusarium gaditjirri]|uniref:Uncharacterized protein n=1 Tax=Fusarium gaditjirri TaxID=282569 RepID=A0A8H4TDV7_9HYPO|nr:hypothetical protein FGADI_4102 [Fusarium gaditjirri]